MTPEINDLPYRPCVGLMILNAEGHIFAAQRLDHRTEAWQMPQGGIDPGETPLVAALRELEEETGITPDLVHVIRESAHWIPYDLPVTLVPKLWGGQYRGQTQKWFALRFNGLDSQINIQTQEPEFHSWAWMSSIEVMEKIVPFKQVAYREVFEEFSDLID